MQTYTSLCRNVRDTAVLSAQFPFHFCNHIQIRPTLERKTIRFIINMSNDHTYGRKRWRTAIKSLQSLDTNFEGIWGCELLHLTSIRKTRKCLSHFILVTRFPLATLHVG